MTKSERQLLTDNYVVLLCQIERCSKNDALSRAAWNERYMGIERIQHDVRDMLEAIEREKPAALEA